MTHDALCELRIVIKKIVKALKGIIVPNSDSIEAISLWIYSQLVRRANEIYILLHKNCSLGALGLMMGLYEGSIILQYVALDKGDGEIAKRYISASYMQAYRMLKDKERFYSSHDGSSDEGRKLYRVMIEELEETITQLLNSPKLKWEKLLHYDYWWAYNDTNKGKGKSINGLIERIGIENDYMYHYLCSLCHFNTFSTMTNEDEEGKLIIGSWDGRTAEAIRYTCWYLGLGTDGFCKVVDSPSLKECISALQIIADQTEDIN